MNGNLNYLKKLNAIENLKICATGLLSILVIPILVGVISYRCLNGESPICERSKDETVSE
jgi:hypothetical protein